jgi:hypothetical protein
VEVHLERTVRHEERIRVEQPPLNGAVEDIGEMIDL